MIGMTYIITCKFSAIIYTDDMPAQPLGGHMKLNPLFLTTLVVLMLFVIVDQILRRRAYKKVQDLYGQHRSDELLAYLEGRYARLFFPAYNRTYMKFNACLQKDDAERVQIALEELLATKSSDEQRSDLVIRAFEFYLKQGNFKDAKTMLDEIGDMPRMNEVADECRKIYEIVAEGSSAYIDEMQAAKQGAAQETIHRLDYLLSLQRTNEERSTSGRATGSIGPVS